MGVLASKMSHPKVAPRPAPASVELDEQQQTHDNKTSVELESGFIEPQRTAVSRVELWKARAKLVHKVWSVFVVIVFSSLLIMGFVNDYDRFKETDVVHISRRDCTSFTGPYTNGMQVEAQEVELKAFVLAPRSLLTEGNGQGLHLYLSESPGYLQFYRETPGMGMSGPGPWMYFLNSTFYVLAGMQSEGETFVAASLAFLACKFVAALALAVLGVFTILREDWLEALGENAVFFKRYMQVGEPLVTLMFYIPSWLLSWGFTTTPSFYNADHENLMVSGHNCGGYMSTAINGGMFFSPGMGPYPSEWDALWPNGTYVSPWYSLLGPNSALNITTPIEVSHSTSAPNLILLCALVAACMTPPLLVGVYNVWVLVKAVERTPNLATPIAVGGLYKQDYTASAAETLQQHSRSAKCIKGLMVYTLLCTITFVVTVCVVAIDQLPAADFVNIITLDVSHMFDFSFSSPDISQLGAIAGTEALLRVFSYGATVAFGTVADRCV